MLTNANLMTALNLFCDDLIANKAYLSDLDSPIGDGDHGVNMSRGALALKEALIEKQPGTLSETFKLAGMTLLSKVGGASGPLYGSAFMGMSNISGTVLANSELADALQLGMDMVAKRGKSTVGEKTMLDVWGPSIAHIRANDLTTTTIKEAVDATKDLLATKGRASFLGERSIGHIDPGAASSGFFFNSLLKAGVLDD